MQKLLSVIFLDSDITEEQKISAEKVLCVIQTAIDNNTYVVFEF